MGMVVSEPLRGVEFRKGIMLARIKALQAKLRGKDPLGQRERILREIQALHVQILKEV